MKKQPAINDLLKVMAKLRSPKGCPWDREQSHLTLRRHAIEEVYELIDAIEAGDDHEMAEVKKKPKEAEVPKVVPPPPPPLT